MPYISGGRELLSTSGIDYKASGSFGSGFNFGLADGAGTAESPADLDGGLDPGRTSSWRLRTST